MDIYLRNVYIVRKVTSAPTFFTYSNTCLRDVYRTRRVLKIDFEALYMRSAVPPVLVILPPTHANKHIVEIL